MRCGLVFLTCSLFIAVNLVTEELWGLDRAPQEEGEVFGLRGSTGGVAQSAELYKGDFVLMASYNSTKLLEGPLRMTVLSQASSAMGVRISSVSLSLASTSGLSVGSFGFHDADFLLKGVELSGVNRLTATGVSDPANFVYFGTDSCRLDGVFELSELSSDASTLDGQQTHMRPNTFVGQVHSVDCDFSMSFSADMIDIQRVGQKVVHYAIWVNILTVIQIRCFLSQMRYTDEGPSVAKLSIVGIAVQALMDAYDSFLHLSLSASSRYMFNTFAIISLFKFVLFALLEVRYLLTIWRQRRRDVFSAGWDTVRRELSKVYSRFYGILILGLVLIFNCLEHLDLIALAFQAYWIPQILHDVRQGSKNAFHNNFIAGISVTRCLEIVYCWGCPSGVFSGDLYPRLPGSPNPKLCAAVILLQGAQVGVMASQKVLGPRWFIPWICLPNVYNYNRRAAEVPPDAECVICMAELVATEESQMRALTPCGHCFHRSCLEQWMDIKMECPTCRTALPPLT